MESRRKVLVVDDEELNQDLLRFFLSEKFDVYTAGKVGTFYSLIERIDFDLIINGCIFKGFKGWPATN